MKASLKGKYEYETEKAAATSAISTLAIPAGDLKLRASISDAAFIKGPSLNDLSLSLEKPGFFIVDYNVPKQDFRFQFMNSFRILEKKLNMTYSHSRGDNRTMLDGSLVLDPSNKVSANHVLGSRNGKLKYTYVHQGVTTFEPCYDVGKDSWDFSLSRKVYGDDVVKASYQSSNQILGVEWSRNSKTSGCFKLLKTRERNAPWYHFNKFIFPLHLIIFIATVLLVAAVQYSPPSSSRRPLFQLSAILNVAEEVKMPKLMAESTWNFDA